ncbi:unnamed protein product, partial [Ectocarpus sp. 12 AP-2014]
MSFGSGFTSWGTSRADDDRSDQGSAESSAESDRNGDAAVLKQELTWGQFITQRFEDPASPTKNNARGGPAPPRKPPAGFDGFDDDDDNDIDDIMSTFGPVSIRTGREDILFGPQDEEPLPMFDRIIGKARDAASGRPDGKGDGARNSTG